jgi:hypothetical protein
MLNASRFAASNCNNKDEFLFVFEKILKFFIYFFASN